MEKRAATRRDVLSFSGAAALDVLYFSLASRPVRVFQQALRGETDSGFAGSAAVAFESGTVALEPSIDELAAASCPKRFARPSPVHAKNPFARCIRNHADLTQPSLSRWIPFPSLRPGQDRRCQAIVGRDKRVRTTHVAAFALRGLLRRSVRRRSRGHPV
jgi:hypothetical protein